jgi:hypothetical protein
MALNKQSLASDKNDSLKAASRPIGVIREPSVGIVWKCPYPIIVDLSVMIICHENSAHIEPTF